MKRATIERFITKYNLGGTSGAVNWRAKDGNVTVHSASDSRHAVAFITAPIPLEDGEYAIFDTAQLKSLLGILDDDINIKVKRQGGVPIAFEISDNVTKVTFALGEPAMLPKEPTLDMLPPIDLTITLDQQLVDTFVRAKAALSDVETFAVLAKVGQVAKVVLGYMSNSNSNKVTLEARGDVTTDLPVTQYDAKLTREILLANREAPSGRMGVSGEGFLHLVFDVENFSVDYYLPSVQ